MFLYELASCTRCHRVDGLSNCVKCSTSYNFDGSRSNLAMLLLVEALIPVLESTSEAPQKRDWGGTCNFMVCFAVWAKTGAQTGASNLRRPSLFPKTDLLVLAWALSIFSFPSKTRPRLSWRHGHVDCGCSMQWNRALILPTQSSKDALMVSPCTLGYAVAKHISGD